MSAAESLTAAFHWQSWAVFRRNALVFLRNWRTAVIPPAMEPVIFFVAFGIGFSGYIEDLDYRGAQMNYATYVAAGLIAYTGFGTPYYEALYAAYVRMFYQKTWDGILATQVELPSVVWGEILWAAVRGMVNISIVCSVIAVFDVIGVVDVKVAFLVFMPFLGFIAGCAFASFALIFTAIVPAIDHMNYPVFLIGWPLSLVSNTFFPIDPQSVVLRALWQINPVYQLAEAARGLLVFGDPGPHLVGLLGSTLLFLVPCTVLSTRLTRRRVLGE
ncbi:MAG: ABC transporter permease [Myxococcales bacterium]|nr:ABC transporter permease [Myxococcales bacterium]